MITKADDKNIDINGIENLFNISITISKEVDLFIMAKNTSDNRNSNIHIGME